MEYDVKKSTHKAAVVEVRLEPHPNADSLSVVKVWGYEVCVKSSDWVGIEKAVYIMPDSVVDVKRPEFTFLAQDANSEGKARVKARRFRGSLSFGLLVPAPADASIGDDLASFFGVERYEPTMSRSKKDKFVIGGEEEAGPNIDTGPSMYDIDAFEVFYELFQDGEPVHVTEKLDGSNARFVYHDGRYWVKSRKRWVRRQPNYSHVTVEGLVEKGCPQEKAEAVVAGLKEKTTRGLAVNGYWGVMERTAPLMAFLLDNPGVVVFGEVYGSTNRIKYGFPDGNRFAAFDVFKDGRFLDPEEAWKLLSLWHVPMVPMFNPVSKAGLEALPYSFKLVKDLAEAKGTTAKGAKPGTIREGRRGPSLGREVRPVGRAPPAEVCVFDLPGQGSQG
jgi:RNA ligase (TIGR02306 family)